MATGLKNTFNPKINVRTNKDDIHESVKGDVYITSIASEFGVDEGLVKKAWIATAAGEDLDTEGMDKKQKKAADKVLERVASDHKIHTKNKEKFTKWEEKEKADKAANKEKAKAENEKSKTESIAVFEKASSSKEIVKATSAIAQNVDTQVQALLGKKFELKDSEIVIKDGAKVTKEDFANALAGFDQIKSIVDGTDDSLLKREAQIGLAAETALGDKWVDLYGKSPKSLSRVQTGIRILKTAKAIGKTGMKVYAALPLSNMRAALEIKVITAAELGGDKAKADETNLKAKKAVCKLVAEAIEEQAKKGAKLSQSDIRKIVADYKASLGIESTKKFTYLYVYVIGEEISIVGMNEIEEAAFETAALVLKSTGHQVLKTKEGKYVLEAITGPTKAILEYIKENATEPSSTDDDEKETKGKGKKGKDEDKGKGKEKEGKKGKGKKQEVEEKEEDEDEDEDSSEDEDEDEDEKKEESSDDDSDDDDSDDEDEDEDEDEDSDDEDEDEDEEEDDD